MSRAFLCIAVVLFCAARVSAAEKSGNETKAELHAVPVSTLLERIAKSTPEPGEAKLLRAVADLMEQEEAYAKDHVPPPGEAKPTRLCIRLKNSPATDAAKEVQALFDRDEILPRPEHPGVKCARAVVTCDPISNSLLISAPPQLAEFATILLAKLDTRPKMITFKVYIGELKTTQHDVQTSHATAADAGIPSMQEDGAVWLADAMKKGRLDLRERPQATTLDGQTASVEIGQRIPVLPRGTFKTVGDIVSLTPSILPDGMIAIRLDFEDSLIDPKEAALTIRKSENSKTTVTAKEGQTIIVRVSGARESIVALTPQICR